MSQMIKSCSQVCEQQVISVPKREAIVPRFKNLLEPKTNYRKRNSEIWGEEVVMMKLLRKLGDKELQMIQDQNKKEISKKFNHFKKKMRKTVSTTTNENEINNIFNQQKIKPGQTLAICLSNGQSERVDIVRKYRTKILMNLEAIKEITQIQNNKQKYREWYNSYQNSPSASPNFTRMSYKLEQARKQSMNFKIPVQFKEEGRKNKFRSSCDSILREKQSSFYISKSKLSDLSKKFTLF